MLAEEQQVEKDAAELLAHGFSQQQSQQQQQQQQQQSHVIDATAHPILRLGWRPLCSIVCNGLHGEFLGGHDRDMFVYSADLGGRVITCSQFERESGRALSKKWKESLQVVPNTTTATTNNHTSTNTTTSTGTKLPTTRCTLLAWLKRHAEKDYGQAVVGKTVWVLSPGNLSGNLSTMAHSAATMSSTGGVGAGGGGAGGGLFQQPEWRKGTVIAYNRDAGKHTVEYLPSESGGISSLSAVPSSSRLTEDLHLPAEKVCFSEMHPCSVSNNADGGNFEGINNNDAATTATVVTAPTTQLPTAHQRQQQQQHAPSALWHQGSGISVSSSMDEELRAAAAVAVAVAATGNGVVACDNDVSPSLSRGLRSGKRRPRASLKTATSLLPTHTADGLSMEPPPPKRTVSAPAAVLLLEAAAAAAAAAAGVPSTQLHAQMGFLDNNNTVAPSAAKSLKPTEQQLGGVGGGGGCSVSPLTPHYGRSFTRSPPNGAAPTAPPTVLPPPSTVLPLPPPPPPQLATSLLSPTQLTEATPLIVSSQNVSAGVGWMHDIVLSLDEDLEQRTQSLASAVQHTAQANRGDTSLTNHTNNIMYPILADNDNNAISVSAQFQSLLGLLHAKPACLYGLFDGMRRRFEHYQSDGALQRRKLVDFVVASVQQSAVLRVLIDTADDNRTVAGTVALPVPGSDRNGSDTPPTQMEV